MVLQRIIGYMASATKMKTRNGVIKPSFLSYNCVGKILLGQNKLILYPIEDIINKISVKDCYDEPFIPIVKIAETVFEQDIPDYNIINNGLFYGIEFKRFDHNMIFAYSIDNCSFDAWWSDKDDVEYKDSIKLKNTYKIYDLLNKFHIDYRDLINQDRAINIHSFNKNIYQS